VYRHGLLIKPTLAQYQVRVLVKSSVILNDYLPFCCLGLVKDQQYWVAVQARNVGGLWSTSGVWPFIAGQKSYRKIYMPLILRN